MVTCKQRTEARAITLPQFHALGYHPIVFESACEPASIQQLNETATKAIKYAADAGTHMLYIEDDIDLNPELFPWAIELCKQIDSVTYLYLNDFTYRLRPHYGPKVRTLIEKKKPIPRGAYEIKERLALFGTQCVFIPARLMPAMVNVIENDDPKQYMNPWDGRLLEWTRAARREKIYSILTHPVQHRQDITAWESRKRNVMRSMSYASEWIDERTNVFH